MNECRTLIFCFGVSYCVIVFEACLDEVWTGKEKRPELMSGHKGDSDNNEEDENRKKEMEELEKTKRKEGGTKFEKVFSSISFRMSEKFLKNFS